MYAANPVSLAYEASERAMENRPDYSDDGCLCSRWRLISDLDFE